MSTWNQPIFTAGQVISAAGHLNPLADGMRVAHDKLVACVQAPFTGFGSWYHPATWYFRHSGDATGLYWKADGNGATITFRINGVVAWTVTGNNQSGTFTNFAAHGLNDGSIYTIAASVPDGSAPFRVWQLRENLNSLGTLSLATFNDGTVPTAAQWNALADGVGRLYRFSDMTQVPGIVPYETRVRSQDDNGMDYLWVGSANYRGGRLAYYITAQNNYSNDNQDQKIFKNTVRIKVNGVTVKTLDDRGGRGEWHEYEGTIDLSGVCTVGQDYTINVQATTNCWWDTSACLLRIHYFFEVPYGTQSVAGWQTMSTYSHGSYVYGSTVNPLTPLRSNIITLHGSLGVSSHRAAPASNGAYVYFIRTKRLLYYWGVAGNPAPAPVITFTDGTIGSDGKYVYQTASLPSGAEMHIHDLDAVSGLFPGMRYQISNTAFAFEHDMPA